MAFSLLFAFSFFTSTWMNIWHTALPLTFEQKGLIHWFSHQSPFAHRSVKIWQSKVAHLRVSHVILKMTLRSIVSGTVIRNSIVFDSTVVIRKLPIKRKKLILSIEKKCLKINFKEKSFIPIPGRPISF